MTRTTWPTVVLVGLAMLVVLLAGCGGDAPCQEAGSYCDGSVACNSDGATDCAAYADPACPTCGRCVVIVQGTEPVAVCTRVAP